jgi:glycine hydroxymethyltransferase
MPWPECWFNHQETVRMAPVVHDGYFTLGLDSDPELAKLIHGEFDRQRDSIELIASENIVSRLVLEAQGSGLTNKTVEGLPFARYYGGAEFADAIQEAACAGPISH